MHDAIKDELQKALEKYDIPWSSKSCWQHKQSKKWILLHTYCEKLAARAGVKYDAPVVVEADTKGGVAVVLVTGHLGDRTEWTYGEANPKNCTMAYPFALAEKRAKDKVILKLIGLHGSVYSEAEAEDFKDEQVENFDDTEWDNNRGFENFTTKGVK